MRHSTSAHLGLLRLIPLPTSPYSPSPCPHPQDVRAAVCYLHVAAHPLHSDTWLERVANEPKRGLGGSQGGEGGAMRWSGAGN